MGKGKSTATWPQEDIPDDEFYNDGRHEMTDEECRRYEKQIQDSQGFDVESFPNLTNCGLIRPYTMRRNYADNLLIIQFAIDHHNKIQGGNLKLVRIIKWNRRFFGPCYHDNFITFLAEDRTTCDTDTYQAMVATSRKKEDWKVPIFRKKPNHETNKGMKEGGNTATLTESNAQQIRACGCRI